MAIIHEHNKIVNTDYKTHPSHTKRSTCSIRKVQDIRKKESRRQFHASPSIQNLDALIKALDHQVNNVNTPPNQVTQPKKATFDTSITTPCKCNLSNPYKLSHLTEF